MSEPPAPPSFASKAAMYEWLAKQTGYMVDGMSRRLTPQANLVIGLGNVAALCFYELNRFADPTAPLQAAPINWFGFYLLQAPGLLALGPFQGRPACTQIAVGKGVCGAAAERGRTLIVSDVHEFPGHIACDAASNAEVVVPIQSDNGTVLGVIDVDSSTRGQFDEVDGRGLEAIARVLAQHLEFPMQRALAVNPSLGMPSFSVTSGGMDPVPNPEQQGKAPALPPPPPTTVSTTAIPFFRVEPLRPDSTRKELHDWSFSTTRLDRITSQAELQGLEERLGIAAFPEIQFPFNTFTAAWGAGEKSIVLAFDAVSILSDAASYYTSAHFKETVEPQMSIPVSEAWASTPFPKHNPGVDWAWRHRFFGIPGAELAVRLHPAEEGSDCRINWELLKDRTLPIILFDSFDFMEDDLHDHGMTVCSIKYRVMEQAFFILLRQYVRVDGHALWLRDVRFYHEFSWPQRGKRSIAVEEQTRLLSLVSGERDALEVDWRSLSIDELAQRASVLATNEFTLTF